VAVTESIGRVTTAIRRGNSLEHELRRNRRRIIPAADKICGLKWIMVF
jgi:hypothetical protein